jgi:3-hydroxyisobutyrate dehydrogenase
MGGGAAICLAKSGRPLTVYDIDPSAALKWPGGEIVPAVAASCAVVASKSDVVIILVVSVEQVWSVLNGPQGLLAGARPGLVVVVASTIDLDDLAELRVAAFEAGIELIDCGVTACPGGHDRNGIIGMVGADLATFDRIREVFDDFMQEVFLMGGPGAGMSTKIVRNLLYYATWRAACEAAALADAAGIDVAKLAAIHTLSERGGSAAAIWLRAHAARHDPVPLTFSRDHLAQVMLKDIAAADALSHDLALSLPLVDLVGRTADEIVAPWPASQEQTNRA